MQDPNDANAIPRRPELKDMLPNPPPPVAHPDMRAVRSPQRSIRHRGTRRLDQLDISQRLRHSPLRHAILEHQVEGALRLGVSRYSPKLRSFTLLEGGKVERLRSAAILPRAQRLTNGLGPKPPLLLPPDKITNSLGVIIIVARIDLRRDPGILLLGKRNGLTNGRYVLPFILSVRLRYHTNYLTSSRHPSQRPKLLASLLEFEHPRPYIAGQTDHPVPHGQDSRCLLR
ncbi:hypothetical protein C8J43_10822 [Sphingomonas sp. PP-CE-1G-424]|nr:hypothetical protein C8J43_10822 [Sphingomonas sp. PP-CE-1G-424]